MPTGEKIVQPYNSAFFKSVENSFLIISEWYGKEHALKFVSALMERSLGPAYVGMGAKELSGDSEFKRCVGERDASVGLKISFQDIDKDSFAYRFHTDPFPGLKGKVDPYELDATYMRFKVNFFLGPKWSYSTTKHLWKGDDCTEHMISRKTAMLKNNMAESHA